MKWIIVVLTILAVVMAGCVVPEHIAMNVSELDKIVAILTILGLLGIVSMKERT